MADEVKDENVNEETEAETIESAEEVVTSPTVETPNDDKFVQLEQRITSLEQRINGQEQQEQQQEPPNVEESQPSDVSDDDAEDEDIETNDEIKKILGL